MKFFKNWKVSLKTNKLLFDVEKWRICYFWFSLIIVVRNIKKTEGHFWSVIKVCFSLDAQPEIQILTGVYWVATHWIECSFLESLVHLIKNNATDTAAASVLLMLYNNDIIFAYIHL